VEHVGAVDKVQFFTGATNMLYAFGGHAITIEIMEATKRPSKFKFVYLAVVFYTFAVTIPSAVSTYWAFGDILLHRSNAFAVLPPSPWRTFAIVSIILHQSMVFVLFVHPVFLVFEKFAKVHTRSLGLRILVRIPVVLFLWFVALAIPFFGPINSVMGAFLVTFAVYIIPLVAFFVTYRTKAARQNSAVKLPPFMPSWMLMFLFNGMIVLWMVIVGCGIGGWASVTNFVRQISSFGFFDKCYQC
jgi:auxin influx carrier (AUX1 LAX family)